ADERGEPGLVEDGDLVRRGERAELGERRLRVVVGARVVERDPGAFARERRADRASEAPRAAGDERDPRVQQTHYARIGRGNRARPNFARGVFGPFAAPRWNMLKPHAGMILPSICG